jgi:hypothetical protein
MRRLKKAGRPAAAVKKKSPGKKKAAAAKKTAGRPAAAAAKKRGGRPPAAAAKKRAGRPPAAATAAAKKKTAAKKAAVARRRGAKKTSAKKSGGFIAVAPSPVRTAAARNAAPAHAARRKPGRPPASAAPAEKIKRKHPMYEQYMAELEKTMQRDNEKLADVYRKAAEKAKTNPSDIDKCTETLGKYLMNGGSVVMCGRNFKNLMKGR